MTINLQKPDITELKPKITVFGVGGGGGNAVNNMISGGLEGVEFVVANTDAQALTMSKADKLIQLGVEVTEGLGAGSKPNIGCAAAEECIDEISDYLSGTHMAFVTAGMGGGTGTGAAPVVARAAREMGVLTVGVVTKPFHFEGQRRMKTANDGILELQKHVDTLIVIPNQNLFRIANDKTTFADAFGMADQVLYSGVACITDLMVKEGLINLDFADVRSVMHEMGRAMMGTGEASGEDRAMHAAEAAISNPLLDETSMRGAQGLLISITGGRDLTLFEVDEAATRIREEVDEEANIILGATFDESLEGVIRVSVVATGIDKEAAANQEPIELPRAVTSNATAGAPKPVQKAPEATRIAERPAERLATGAQPAMQAAKPVEATARPVAASSVIAEAKPAIAENTASSAVEKDGVRLEPYRPASSLLSSSSIEDDFKHALEEELMPVSEELYIPVKADEPDSSYGAASSQKIEDFTVNLEDIGELDDKIDDNVTQRAMASIEHSEENGPMGLLKKLRTGLGGREEATAAGGNSQHSATNEAARRATHEPVSRPVARPQVPSASEAGARVDNNPYAPRKAHLDDTGRAQPKSASMEEDQLEIPAFLRRQSN